MADEREPDFGALAAATSPTPREAPDYAELARATDPTYEVQENVWSAHRHHQADSARVLDLAQQTGLEPDLVARNLALVGAEVAKTQLRPDLLSDASPTVLEWLKDPWKARAIADELENMTWLERYVTRPFSEGVAQRESMLRGAWMANWGMDPDSDSYLLEQERLGRSSTPRGAGLPTRMITGSIRLAPNMIGGLGKGFLAGVGTAGMAAVAAPPAAGISVPTAFAFGMLSGSALDAYEIERGNAYVEAYRAMKEQGVVDVGNAQVFSTVAGLINGGAEVLADAAFLRSWKWAGEMLMGAASTSAKAAPRATLGWAAREFAKSYGLTLAAETGTEAFQRGVTDVSTQVGLALSGGKGDLREIPGNMADEFVAALESMALLGLIGPSGELTVNGHKVIQTSQLVRKLNEAKDVLTNSRLVRENPSLTKLFVDEVLRGAGGDNTLFVPIKEWDRLFQDAKFDPEATAAEVLGDNGRAYQTAKAAGTDLAIPVSAWVARVTGLPVYDELVLNAKLDPNGLTQRQVVAALNASIWKAQAEKKAEGGDFAQRVADAIALDLVRAGVPRDIAEDQAALWAARIRSAHQTFNLGLAERGQELVSQEQLFEGLNVRVFNPELEAEREAQKAVERVAAVETPAVFPEGVGPVGVPAPPLEAAPEAESAAPVGPEPQKAPQLPGEKPLPPGVTKPKLRELSPEEQEQVRAYVRQQFEEMKDWEKKRLERFAERAFQAPFTRGGGSVIVSRSTAPGAPAWRVTYLDEAGQPTGHTEASSYGEALKIAQELGDLSRVSFAETARGKVAKGAVPAPTNEIPEPQKKRGRKKKAAPAASTALPSQGEGPPAPSGAATTPASTPPPAAGAAAGSTWAFSIIDPSRAYPMVEVILPLPQVIASHDTQGRRNPDFDSTLQPWDRSSAASRMQIERGAGNAAAAPSLIHDQRALDRGSPIIAKNGMVLSGNGRTLMLQLAQENGLPLWDNYQEELKKYAAERGLEYPEGGGILVRRIDFKATHDELVQFAAEANGRVAKEPTPLERAKLDAEHLTDALVLALPVSDTGTIEDALQTEDGAAWMRDFLAGYPPSEWSRFVDLEGRVGTHGLRAVADALFIYTFGGEYGEQILRSMRETMGESRVAMERALFNALPRILKLKAAAAQGVVRPQYDLSSDLPAALSLLRMAKSRGQQLRYLIEQPPLIEGALDLGSELQQEIALWLDENLRRSAEMGQVLNRYATMALATPPPSQAELFGPPPTPGELFREAVNQVSRELARAREAARKGAQKTPDATLFQSEGLGDQIQEEWRQSVFSVISKYDLGIPGYFDEVRERAAWESLSPEHKQQAAVLWGAAERAEEWLSKEFGEFAAEVGGQLVRGPVKRLSRAAIKIEDPRVGFTRLTDVSRATVVFDSFDQLVAAWELFSARYKTAKIPKNRFIDAGKENYRDILAVVLAPNGMPVEIQFHLREILDAKEAKGHILYERSVEVARSDLPLKKKKREKRRLDAEAAALYGAALRANVERTKPKLIEPTGRLQEEARERLSRLPPVTPNYWDALSASISALTERSQSSRETGREEDKIGVDVQTSSPEAGEKMYPPSGPTETVAMSSERKNRPSSSETESTGRRAGRSEGIATSEKSIPRERTGQAAAVLQPDELSDWRRDYHPELPPLEDEGSFTEESAGAAMREERALRANLPATSVGGKLNNVEMRPGPNGSIVIMAPRMEMYREEPWVDLRGQDISNAQKLAKLARRFRSPHFETLRAFWVDGKGRIVAHEAITSYRPTEVNVLRKHRAAPGSNFYDARMSRRRQLEWFQDMVERGKRLSDQHGAVSFWLVHNHPSGYAQASENDVNFTKTMSKVFGPVFRGHIVIDHDHYSHINRKGAFTIKPQREAMGVPDPLLSGPVSGYPLLVDRDVLALGRRAYQEGFDQYDMVIYANSRMEAVALEYVPRNLLRRVEKAGDHIRGRAKVYGAESAFIYSNTVKDFPPGSAQLLVESNVVTDIVFDPSWPASPSGPIGSQRDVSSPQVGYRHGRRSYAAKAGSYRLYQSEPIEQDRDLFVRWDTDLEKIEGRIARYGPMVPAPSMMVQRAGVGPEQFGKVTFLGPNTLAKEHTYGADIYSPRRIEDELVSPTDTVADWVRGDREGVVGLEAWAQKQDYLTQDQRDRLSALVEFWPWTSREQAGWSRDEQVLADWAITYDVLEPLLRYMEEEEPGRSPGRSEAEMASAKKMAESLGAEKAAVLGYDAQALEWDSRPRAEKLAWLKTIPAIGTRVRKAAVWLAPLLGEPALEEREDIAWRDVEAMQQYPWRVGEGGGFWGASAMTLRALVTPQFRGIQEVRENRDRIVSNADYISELEARVDEMVGLLSELQRLSEDVDGGLANVDPRWGLTLLVREAVTDKSPNLNDEESAEWDQRISDYLDEKLTPLSEQEYEDSDEKTPLYSTLEWESARDDLATRLSDLLDDLRASPSLYFEIKPPRPVRYREFTDVIVEKGAVDRFKQALPEFQGRIHEQDPELSRAEFALQVAQKSGLLFQSDSQVPPGKRGYIEFEVGGRTFRIALKDPTDLSSFLHESAHAFAELLEQLAARPDAPPAIVEDARTLRAEVGAEGRLTPDQTEAHERLAETFEVYLRTGEAPSVDLARVFSRFRAWLVSIYRNVATDPRLKRARLTPEIRDVLDRMLATQDEIAAAREGGLYDPIFATAVEAGMTQEEFEDYRRRAEEQRREAEEALFARLMEQRRRETQAWFIEEKARIRAEVEARMDQDPARQAAEFLHRGTMPNDAEVPAGLLDAEGRPVKLDGGILAQLLGPRWEQVRQRLAFTWRKEGGVDPQLVAEFFGFSSGSEMIEQIIAQPSREKVIAAEQERQLKELYGDLDESGALGEAAHQVLHGPEGRLALLEEEANRINRRRAKRDPPVAAAILREAVRRAVGEFVVRELRPGQYLVAERRAAKDVQRALARGDSDAAFVAQQQRLLNHLLYVETTKARDRAERHAALGRAQARPAARERLGRAKGTYLEHMDEILNQFEFQNVTLVELDRRENLRDFIAAEEAAGNDVVIDAAALEKLGRRNWRELKVSELQTVADAIYSILHLARLKRMLLGRKNAREFDAVVNELVEAALKSFPDRGPPPLSPQVRQETRRSKLRTADATMMKWEQIFLWLDGGTPGPWTEYIWQPIADAEDVENTLTLETTKLIVESFELLPSDLRKRILTEKIHIRELKQDLYRHEIIAIAHNVGNAGNREKLLLGYGWDEATLSAILSHLSVEEMRFVQRNWDALKTLWPRIAALEEELTGLPPEKVEPVEFEFKGQRFPGGYYPVKYDPELSAAGRRAEELLSAAGDLYDAGYTRAITAHGHTIKRVKFAAPILLSLNIIPRHIDQVVHDLAFRIPLQNAYRILNDERIMQALSRTLGREYVIPSRGSSPIGWLKAIANDRVRAWNAADDFYVNVMLTLRASMTTVAMGFKATTILAQLAGLSTSLDRVHSQWLLKGLALYAKNPRALTREVFSRSKMMTHRSSNLERDMKDKLRQQLGKRDWRSKQARAAMLGVAWFDRVVSVPTWWGAYEQALAEGKTEKQAVAAGDRAVRLTQGSGSTKDLASVARSNELMKMFTSFFSYFSALYSQLRNLGHDSRVAYREGNLKSRFPHLLMRSFYIWIIPALMSELLANRGPDDDDDEGWAAWTIRKVAVYPALTIPLLRDAASAIDFGMEPRWSPVFQALKEGLYDPLNTLADEDASWTDVAKETAEGAAYVAGAPVAQAKITGEYLWDIYQGYERPESVSEFLKGLMFRRKK